MALPIRSRRRVWLGLGWLALGAGAACGRSDEQDRVDPTAAPIAEFNRRIDAYVKLHDSLSAALGPLDETRSQAEIAARTTSLATTITNARSQAKRGDIFTPDVAAVFATMIKEEHRRRSDSVQKTREDQVEEHELDGLPGFVPQVNQVFPTTYPLATFPPRLLPLLPKLPQQLEYRIQGHYLMLRDIEANLIVDFMPNAVP